jgi:hypothetical protein
MTTQSITQNQEKQLKRFLEDASISATRSALAQVPLDKEGAQQVIERGDALKAEIERATINALKKLGSRYPVFAETTLLQPVAQATIPARTKSWSAAEFYQTGPGLYVYGTFADRLDVSARQSIELDSATSEARPYVALLLKANAYDKDIRKELPETHLSTLEDIAGLIEAQPDGSPGFLLNNGYANIFYVEGKNGEVFAVRVHWYSDYREWIVHDWKLDEFGDWGAGRQVLCPGNAAL